MMMANWKCPVCGGTIGSRKLPREEYAQYEAWVVWCTKCNLSRTEPAHSKTQDGALARFHDTHYSTRKDNG
jgi:hypothetical protein